MGLHQSPGFSNGNPEGTGSGVVDCCVVIATGLSRHTRLDELYRRIRRWKHPKSEAALHPKRSGAALDLLAW
jgi:hypothetical protein